MKMNCTPPTIIRRCLQLCAALVGIHELSAPAFEGDEHQDFGNIAVAANLGELSRQTSAGNAKVAMARQMLSEFLTGMREKADMPAVTYGDIVRLVDFMKDNYRLTHRRNAGPNWPQSAAETDVAYLQRLSDDNLSNLSAAHTNQDHFQARVFYTFWFWHKEAVEVASEGNLWGALLLNAYADHFLQDSFAPGHIISPRDENSHDLYAAIVHDACNCHGMQCHIQSLEECRDALKKVIRLCEAMNAGEVAFKPQRVKLDVNVGLHLLGQRELRERFYGDSQVNKEPSQPVMLACYCTESVANIVNSFLTGTKQNSFANYHFNLRFAAAAGLGQIELIDVWQDYGNMTWVERDLPKPVIAANMKLYVPDKKGGVVRKPAADAPEGIVAPLSDFAARNPGFAVSLGYQGWATGYDSQVRALAEAEMMVLGSRWDYLRDDFAQAYFPKRTDMFGLTLGYSGAFDSDSHANGFLSRFVVPINQLDMQLSLYGGARYYSGNGVDGWADFEGIRADWGMQLGNLFLGIGRDHYPTTKGLKDGVSIQAGMSFSFPYSFIPGVMKHY